MALFNRRKSQTISELESYYAGQGNQNAKAWVMAFLSLLVTVGVITALFFGGRWVYRTLTDDDKEKIAETTQTTTKQSGSVNADGTLNVNEKDQVATNTDETTVINDDTNATPSADFPSVVTDQAARTDVPSTTRPTTPTPKTPTTGDSELPNTGAGEILIIAPVVSIALGYFVSRKRQLNQ